MLNIGFYEFIFQKTDYFRIEPFQLLFFLHTVQFDDMEKCRMSPTKDGKTRPLQRHSSGCLVNTKMTSLDHSNSSLGERIDPTMSLESQLWVWSWCFIFQTPLCSDLLCLYSNAHLLPIRFVHLFLLMSSTAGIMEPSAEQMQSLCSACARRPAI